MNDDRPRGYDMAQYQKDVLAGVNRVVKDIELRKWCVEKCFGAPPSVEANILLTYEFITASMREPTGE